MSSFEILSKASSLNGKSRSNEDLISVENLAGLYLISPTGDKLICPKSLPKSNRPSTSILQLLMFNEMKFPGKERWASFSLLDIWYSFSSLSKYKNPIDDATLKCLESYFLDKNVEYNDMESVVFKTIPELIKSPFTSNKMVSIGISTSFGSTSPLNFIQLLGKFSQPCTILVSPSKDRFFTEAYMLTPPWYSKFGLNVKLTLSSIVPFAEVVKLVSGWM